MKTQEGFDARWRYWRWDRTQPFEMGADKHPAPLYLESRDLSASHASDGSPDVPSFTLYVRFDECSHLYAARLDSPDVPATWGGRPADTISDYIHICGEPNFDLLINLLTEAKLIAREWYNGYAGNWK